MPAPPPPPQPPMPKKTGFARKTPHGVLQVDWPFFGELCRALALKIFREYDPDVVIGIAKAGVIPGAVVASILQRDFASVADRKSTRLNSSHLVISYAVFCLKKKKGPAPIHSTRALAGMDCRTSTT